MPRPRGAKMNSSRPERVPCIPPMRTGFCLQSRARSPRVTSTTAAPSLIRQQSNSRNGSTTMRADWCAAKVSGCRMIARGLFSACWRIEIGTAASCSLVTP